MTKKEWIDNASYEELLTKWRFAPIDDPFFQGEIGDYFAMTMNKRRKEIDNLVELSKKVGWEN